MRPTVTPDGARYSNHRGVTAASGNVRLVPAEIEAVARVLRRFSVERDFSGFTLQIASLYATCDPHTFRSDADSRSNSVHTSSRRRTRYDPAEFEILGESSSDITIRERIESAESSYNLGGFKFRHSRAATVRVRGGIDVEWDQGIALRPTPCWKASVLDHTVYSEIAVNLTADFDPQSSNR